MGNIRMKEETSQTVPPAFKGQQGYWDLADNLQEMDGCLERHTLPELAEE